MNAANENRRIVLLTGNGLRHRYVAARLAETTNLVGVACEQKAQLVSKPEQLSDDDANVVAKHLGQRDAVEKRLLGPQIDLPAEVASREVEHGTSNSQAVFDWVRSLNPDFIVLYGTSIIKPPLLDAYGDRMVNIHLGLSPYYRGSGTNFWPLVHRRPEFVGATLHIVSAKVDAGPILAQVRPAAEVTDRSHELGTKTIIAAAELMPRVLARLAEGRLEAVPQDLSGGTVCRRRDFNADAVRTMWRNFETGMMEEYLAEADARQAASPIVELTEQ